VECLEVHGHGSGPRRLRRQCRLHRLRRCLRRTTCVAARLREGVEIPTLCRARWHARACTRLYFAALGSAALAWAAAAWARGLSDSRRHETRKAVQLCYGANLNTN
jgi:hypothetical protein